MTQEDKYKQMLNPKAFIGMKKDEFKKIYKGKLPFDLNAAWDWICTERKK